MRDARLVVDNDGRATAAAEYAYVAESAQPSAHAAVVELCRELTALAPAADLIVCRAIDATGSTAGFGVPLANKRIECRNLPSRAVVAWNRARGRAAVAAVASLTDTEYLLDARDIIVGSARLVRRAGEAWVRGKARTRQVVRDATELAAAGNTLAPPPIAIQAVGPLEEGELPPPDPVSFITTMITNNLLPRLFKGDAVAPMILQIDAQVDKLAQLERWRLLDAPPIAELAALRQVLLDLHAVAAERASRGQMTQFALAASAKRGLSATATLARRRAGARMQTVADQLEKTLATAGFRAHVLRREGKPDSPRWPNQDFLVLVEVATIFEWERQLETLTNLCRSPLKDRIGFLMAPVRAGRVVASAGIKVLDNVFPDESVRDWSGLSLLDERLGDRVRAALAGLHEASGIIATLRRGELHDHEVAAFQAAVGRAHEALRYVVDLANEGDQLLIEVRSTLLDLNQRVEDEAAALRDGQPVDRSLAASTVAGVDGKGDDVFFAQVGYGGRLR